MSLPAKPHDLRRTALSHLGRLGISPIIIGHVANHVSTTRNTVTTAVYVQHDYLAEKREALTTWDAAMARILRGDDPLVSAEQRGGAEGLIAMSTPDPKCARCQPEDFVDVVMVRDEHSAAPGQGCDLDRITPPDRYLVDLAMKVFRIDPQSSGARQHLARVLRKKWRSERPGRRDDDMLLDVEIALQALRLPTRHRPSPRNSAGVRYPICKPRSESSALAKEGTQAKGRLEFGEWICTVPATENL